MTQSSFEQARVALSIFSGQMSPLYEDAIGSLNDDLLSQAKLGDLSQVREQDIANRALLERFRDLLPRTECGWQGYKFWAEDLPAARKIQNSVVWHENTPTYLVGERYGKRKEDMLLLLPRIQKSEEELPDQFDRAEGTVETQGVTIYSRTSVTKKKVESFTTRNLDAPFPDGNIEAIHDMHTGKLAIHSWSPESFRLISPLLHAGLREVPVGGLTDSDMGKYDVYNHLARLATVFKVQDSYEGILSGLAGQSESER